MEVIELSREPPERFAVKFRRKKRGEADKSIKTSCNDPRMRTEYINRMAVPIANKLLEWSMIPCLPGRLERS
jgi:hypothetical protein